MGNLETTPVKTQDSVDLILYVGTWYELAKYPFIYESPDAYNARAEYKLMENSTVSVTNSEMVKTQAISVTGTASPVDSSNSKLKVYFPSTQHTGDYYILETDYKTYSLVGSPDRTHLWILSRNKTMDYYTYGVLLTRLAHIYGFDTNKLVPTKQL